MARIKLFSSTHSRFFVPAIAAFLISLVCVLIYGKALNFGFVAFDDDFHVYANPALRQEPLKALQNIWTGQNQVKVPKDRLYAPLTLTTFLIQFRLSGLNPFSYHALNLALHAFNAVLVFFLLQGWLKENKAALLGALIFLVHPLQVEPVVWVSGRKDLLFSFFVLAGLLLYRHYLERKQFRFFIFVSMVFALAVFSKPTAVVFIPLLVLLDWQARRRLRSFQVWAEKLILMLPAVLVVAVNLQGYGLGGAAPEFHFGRFLFVAQTLLFYFGHAVLPTRLSAFYPFPEFYLWPASTWIILASGAAFLLAIACGNKNKRLLAFGAGIALISLVPSLFRAVFYTDGGFASDRYTYLALLGMILMIISRFDRLKIRYVFLLIAFLGLGWLAHGRVPVWKHSDDLAKDIVKNYPYAANAHEHLARSYEKAGMRQEALLHYEEAYRYNPTLWRRGKMNAAFGEIGKAIDDFQLASQEARQPGLFYEDWGLFYLHRKEYAQAKQIFEAALQHDPFNPNLYNDLAGVAFYTNDTEKAIELWEKALKLNPQFSDVYNNLGFIYEIRGRKKQAEQFYRIALEHDPEHHRAKRNLNRVLGLAMESENEKN